MKTKFLYIFLLNAYLLKTNHTLVTSFLPEIWRKIVTLERIYNKSSILLISVVKKQINNEIQKKKGNTSFRHGIFAFSSP